MTGEAGPIKFMELLIGEKPLVRPKVRPAVEVSSEPSSATAAPAAPACAHADFQSAPYWSTVSGTARARQECEEARGHNDRGTDGDVGGKRLRRTR